MKQKKNRGSSNNKKYDWNILKDTPILVIVAYEPRVTPMILDHIIQDHLTIAKPFKL